MTSAVYHKLREQLNLYSLGYPHTKSGTEISILEKLFTEKEAQVFLHLNPVPSTDTVIALQQSDSLAEVRTLLNRMYKKGLIYRRVKGETAKYGAIPFLEGIFQNQVKSMDSELAQMFDEYFEESLHRNVIACKPVLIHRTIPINQAISVSYPMPTYDNSRKIMESQEFIVVTDCICRVQQGLVKKGCDKPLETCFMFGAVATGFADRGMGRSVSVDEALHILQECEAAGLVTQPYNTQTPVNLCNCCPDCCMILRILKRRPRPAEMIGASYRAVVHPQNCEACDRCLERCPMDAIFRGGTGVESISDERCIGCGLCVSTCPAGAIHLEVRSETRWHEPPETGQRLLEEIDRRLRGDRLMGI